MDFNNKVVVITGAAGGIGRATAKLFYDEGGLLTLVDVSEEGLEEALRELGLTEKDRVLAVKADVSKEGEVERYVQETLDKFGTIDVFVNNAGVEGEVQSIIETTEQNLDLVLGVNVKGVYFGLKYVMPVMVNKRGGSIINTASVAGFIGSPGMAPYVASKHAVIGITKSAALEAAAYGVRVNTVCPSPVDNRMMRSIEAGIASKEGEAPKEKVAGAEGVIVEEGTKSDKAQQVKELFAENIPMGRYASNEEIANVIYFLASDQAMFVNGASFRVDGGMAAK